MIALAPLHRCAAASADMRLIRASRTKSLVGTTTDGGESPRDTSLDALVRRSTRSFHRVRWREGTQALSRVLFLRAASWLAAAALGCHRFGARSSRPSRTTTDSTSCERSMPPSLEQNFRSALARTFFRGPNDRQGNARSEAHDSPAACWICMQHAGCPASTLRERACAADSSRPERSRTRCAQKSNRLGLSLSMWWDQYLRVRQRHCAERLHRRSRSVHRSHADCRDGHRCWRDQTAQRQEMDPDWAWLGVHHRHSDWRRQAPRSWLLRPGQRGEK